jgi:hypothetical protein
MSARCTKIYKQALWVLGQARVEDDHECISLALLARQQQLDYEVTPFQNYRAAGSLTP